MYNPLWGFDKNINMASQKRGETIMKNDDIYRSLLRLSEEYDRLVSPLTKQLEIYDRWKEIESPLLRIAELHDDVIRGVTAFDTNMALQLSKITEPYQPFLDNIAAIESMMGTGFSELVQPQVYVPGMSSALSAYTAANVQLVQDVQIAHAASRVSTVAEQVVHASNPWKTDIDVISAFDNTAICNSAFSHLVEMEKAVAGLPDVIAHYNQMTSISAQIASLQQVGLTDDWKSVLTPPELLFGLSDFVLKQYELVQKATDESTITWRLGLIDAASKFVDTQVAWGSALAIDIDDDAPDSGMAVPDFSDLPFFLASAKRDNRDVEDAFNESLFMEITGLGKLIIQKAQVVNDFCKARNKSLIFPEANLLNWAMKLSSTFCRSADMLKEVLDTLSEMFIRMPVIHMIGQHRCFEDIETHRNTSETKKKISQ